MAVRPGSGYHSPRPVTPELDVEGLRVYCGRPGCDTLLGYRLAGLEYEGRTCNALLLDDVWAPNELGTWHRRAAECRPPAPMRQFRSPARFPVRLACPVCGRHQVLEAALLGLAEAPFGAAAPAWVGWELPATLFE